MHRSSSRRVWIAQLSSMGIGSLAFQRALAHQVSLANAVSSEMIRDAQWIADIELTEAEQTLLAKQIQSQLENERKLRALNINVDVGPALAFVPYFFAENLPEQIEEHATQSAAGPAATRNASWFTRQEAEHRLAAGAQAVDWQDERTMAASGIVQQARALRSGQITSRRLTELYLERLKRFDPELRCVVTLTEELALEQAAQADQELSDGKDRGFLHGIPWGAKDILAVPPYPTTWGVGAYRDTVRPNLATVVRRLNEAGAVMLAKLSVGTLAMGDQWYDATTKNPWNLQQGSSGSSAGSCSAVAAGLCTFAIGTETLGSIVSPARRCRVMGLRPSFGRVSRYGCMTLAWSMDKIGPIARHAIDCGIILAAIQGSDARDPTVVDRPLEWPADFEVTKLRVGYVESELSPAEKLVFEMLEAQGAKMIPLVFPQSIPLQPLMVGLDVESAAMHDPLFREVQSDSELGRWGPSFRESQFARGIHYVQSMRARTLLIQETERVLRNVDVMLGGDDLTRTNLTGHPSMVVRTGTEKMQNSNRNSEAASSELAAATAPSTIKLTAKYFGDSQLVAVADFVQQQMPASPELPTGM